MMELVFLGTGAGVPAKGRNVSSVALNLVAENGSVWLFDCGEGTQHQLMHARINPRRINRIFISHLHGDHLFGLPGLLGSRSFHSGTGPLQVYGPPGIAEFIDTVLRLSATHLTYEMTVHEISDGDELFQADGFAVSAGLLDHVIPSFGFRIVEDERPGELQVERLRTLGLGPGPYYGLLKTGHTVIMPDGRQVDGRDYLGPGKPGRVLAILSDTRPTPKAVELARGADIFVHESTYAGTESAMAPRFYHSTCLDAARLAVDAGARRLLLTHVSQRYADLDQLTAEARQVFPATDVMRDFQVVDVPMP